MVIITTGRPLDGSKGFAAVDRAIGRDVCGKENVLVLRIDLDLGKVTASAPDSPIGIDQLPTFSCIIRAVDAADLRGIDGSVKPISIARSNSYTDAAQSL